MVDIKRLIWQDEIYARVDDLIELADREINRVREDGGLQTRREYNKGLRDANIALLGHLNALKGR